MSFSSISTRTCSRDRPPSTTRAWPGGVPTNSPGRTFTWSTSRPAEAAHPQPLRVGGRLLELGPRLSHGGGRALLVPLPRPRLQQGVLGTGAAQGGLGGAEGLLAPLLGLLLDGPAGVQVA